MKTNPLISVILPTFNRGWILKEAVDSVLAQEFEDFELIVVDDGSTDNTRELLMGYSDSLRVMYQQNAGVSAARNRGIREATGGYIAFLDSDDLWLPKKLSIQTAFFKDKPDARVCQTEEIWIRNGVRVNPKKRHRRDSGIIFERSVHLCLVSPSAVMIRRDLFDQVGLFDESIPACEDYDLWLRIGSRYPVYLIETPLIIKRGGHSDQLSRIPGLDRYRIYALRKILDSGRLSNDHYKAAVNALATKCRIYSQGCLKRRRDEEASHYLDLANRYRSRAEPVSWDH